MPDVFELIATIKDIHADVEGTCRECGQPSPCRTSAYVDGVLAARFEEAPVLFTHRMAGTGTLHIPADGQEDREHARTLCGQDGYRALSTGAGQRCCKSCARIHRALAATVR